MNSYRCLTLPANFSLVGNDEPKADCKDQVFLRMTTEIEIAFLFQSFLSFQGGRPAF